MIWRSKTVWIGSLVVALCFLDYKYAVIKECGVLIFALYSILKFTPVRSFIYRMSWSERLVIGSILGLIFFGQLMQAKRVTYPLVTWDMFSQPLEVNSIIVMELFGFTKDGERIRLPLAQYYPVNYFIVPGNPAPGVADPSVPAIVKAVSLVYNAGHPKAPLNRVDVGTMEVLLHPGVQEEKWTVLESYSIGSAPSKF